MMMISSKHARLSGSRANNKQPYHVKKLQSSKTEPHYPTRLTTSPPWPPLPHLYCRMFASSHFDSLTHQSNPLKKSSGLENSRRTKSYQEWGPSTLWNDNNRFAKPERRTTNKSKHKTEAKSKRKEWQQYVVFPRKLRRDFVEEEPEPNPNPLTLWGDVAASQGGISGKPYRPPVRKWLQPYDRIRLSISWQSCWTKVMTRDDFSHHMTRQLLSYLLRISTSLYAWPACKTFVMCPKAFLNYVV